MKVKLVFVKSYISRLREISLQIIKINLKASIKCLQDKQDKIQTYT